MNIHKLTIKAFLAGFLLLSVNPALAQTGPWGSLGYAAPTVITDPATAISGNSVTLNGRVVPNGLGTDAWFEWSTDPALSPSLTNRTNLRAIGSDHAPVTYSISLTGLDAQKAYYFRAVAYNSYGTGFGEIVSLTTTNAQTVTTTTGGNTGAVLPTFTTAGSQLLYARENVLFTHQVSAVSNNGGVVTYRVVSGPEGAFINAVTGYLAWVPTYSQGRAEPYTVVIGAANGQLEATQTLFIKVEDAAVANTAPAAAVTYGNAEPALKSLNIRVEVDTNGDIWVLWETNKPSRHRVIYDTLSEADLTRDFNYANATPESVVLTAEHAVNLGQLEIGTTYYFRTVSKAAGEIDISRERIFVRLPNGEVNLGLASALATLGGILFSPWLLLIAVAILAFMLWRKSKKQNLLIK